MRSFYIGLDISFTELGCIVLDASCDLIISKTVKTKKINEKYNLEKRILSIQDGISFIQEYSNSLIVTEEVLWSSGGQGSKQLAALQIFLRTGLYEQNVEFELIFPSTLKKWTAGKGNADKHDMITAVQTKWNFITKNNNLADAYAMAMYARFLDENAQFTPY